MVNADQLKKLHIGAEWVDALNETFGRFNISTKRQQAARYRADGPPRQIAVAQQIRQQRDHQDQRQAIAEPDPAHHSRQISE